MVAWDALLDISGAHVWTVVDGVSTCKFGLAWFGVRVLLISTIYGVQSSLICRVHTYIDV